MALKEATAVSSLAAAAPTAIEVTVRPTPNAGHGRARGNVERPCLAAVESAATAGAGGSPDGVWAFVADFEGGCIGRDEE